LTRRGVNLAESLKAFHDVFDQVRRTNKAIADSPSPGYERFLIERGVTPICARMMASIAVRSGNRRAKEAQRRPAVVTAIRFLAKRRRNRPAISSRVKVLLAAWEETSIVETIFEDAGLDEREFISLLKSFAEGNELALRRVTEIAASLAPHLPNARGRKVSAASAAHEFFLENTVPQIEPRAYTWDDYNEEYTDPVTEAARREFNLGYFDPHPARRRMKARLRQKSTDRGGST
jgi:hypothetical protein